MRKSFIKLMFLALVFLVSSGDLFAASFDVGGKMGIGMGWWRGEKYNEKTEEVIGAPDLTVGPYISLELHKYFSLQCEVLFSYIGNKDKRVFGIEYSTEFRNFAFAIPIYAKPKLKLGPGDLFFLVGPKLLLLLDDFKTTAKTSSKSIKTEVETDYEVSRQFHLGISYGIGYDWMLGPGKLQFAFQITPYLTDYGKDFNEALQNEFTFDFGYAYTFK
jgi:hypothetical protein